MEQQSATTTHKKQFIGIVASDKMDRTVVVEVTTFKRHPLYHKRYRWTKRYLSDTGEHQVRTGDMVRIQSSRPLSKLKRWMVVEVLSSAAATPAQATKATAKKSTRAAKGKGK